MHGEYQIDAWVDKNNAILEWDYEGDPDDDNNNELVRRSVTANLKCVQARCRTSR